MTLPLERYVHGVYIGPKARFKGRRALLRVTDGDKTVLAQFDFPDGTEFNDRGEPCSSLDPIAHLTSCDIVPSFKDEHPECFGWHSFPKEEFAQWAAKIW